MVFLVDIKSNIENLKSEIRGNLVQKWGGIKSKIENLKSKEIWFGSGVGSGWLVSGRSVTPDDRSDGRAVLARALVY